MWENEKKLKAPQKIPEKKTQSGKAPGIPGRKKLQNLGCYPILQQDAVEKGVPLLTNCSSANILLLGQVQATSMQVVVNSCGAKQARESKYFL